MGISIKDPHTLTDHTRTDIITIWADGSDRGDMYTVGAVFNVEFQIFTCIPEKYAFIPEIPSSYNVNFDTTFPNVTLPIGLNY